MACGSRYSSNAAFLRQQRYRPKHFFHRGIQVEKWRPSILAETMTTGLAQKKSNIISAVSLFENYVS
jgi:hypothetical protein